MTCANRGLKSGPEVDSNIFYIFSKVLSKKMFSKMLWISMISFLSFSTVSGVSLPRAVADEPAYCEPSSFLTKEVLHSDPGLLRLRTFQVGSVRLSGLSIGMSMTSSLISYAEGIKPNTALKKYCSWYVNDRNHLARESFVWRDLRKPDADVAATVANFEAQLKTSFTEGSEEDLISCLAEEKFLAMGCDGQMHRGPSVFAMVLAYSGCTPEHSVAIVNQLWGENGVPPATRMALAEMAAKWAREAPLSSEKVRKAMEE